MDYVQTTCKEKTAWDLLPLHLKPKSTGIFNLGLFCWGSADTATRGPYLHHCQELQKKLLQVPGPVPSLRASHQEAFICLKGVTYLCHHDFQALRSKQQ